MVMDLPKGISWVPFIKIACSLLLILSISFRGTGAFPQEPDPPPSFPFAMGERLSYDISWIGLTVGRGVLEITPDVPFEDRIVLRAVSTARSNRLLSFFYKVRDRVESLIDSSELYSYQIIFDQKRASRKRFKKISFDHDEHVATLYYKGKSTEYSIPSKVQDSLSSLYLLRTVPEFEVGSSIFIDVYASKKSWKLEIQIVSRETLRTVLGKIPTIKLNALVRFEGVLWDKGDFHIWLTDDERRIPVLMKGKIAIGSITATLSEVESPEPRPIPQG